MVRMSGSNIMSPCSEPRRSMSVASETASVDSNVNVKLVPSPLKKPTK